MWEVSFRRIPLGIYRIALIGWYRSYTLLPCNSHHRAGCAGSDNGASIEIDWNGFFWHGTINNPIEPIAKMIVVHGKIVAHGIRPIPLSSIPGKVTSCFGGEESILQKTLKNLNSNTAILTALSWGLLITLIQIVGGHYA